MAAVGVSDEFDEKLFICFLGRVWELRKTKNESHI
jgi:hypothetical protein